MENVIFDRVKHLCEINNISINKLEKTLGFGAAIVSKWKTQMPSSDKIFKIADYFNVSADYLIGITDAPYKIEATKDADLLTIQRAREQMSDAEKEKMMKMLKLTFDYAFREGNEDEDTI